MTVKLTEQQQHLIDDYGVYFESLQLQPIAGKIIGLLLVIDIDRLSFDEIISTLNISKGSASIVLRVLQKKKYVKSVINEGERRRYYQINTQNLFKLLEEFERSCDIVNMLLDKTFELKNDKTSENAIYCQRIMKTINFYKENLMALKEEFKIEKQ